MDKRPIGYVPGKGNVNHSIYLYIFENQPLDKKVPKNTKYQHV
jgi:hypothetical protein